MIDNEIKKEGHSPTRRNEKWTTDSRKSMIIID